MNETTIAVKLPADHAVRLSNIAKLLKLDPGELLLRLVYSELMGWDHDQSGAVWSITRKPEDEGVDDALFLLEGFCRAARKKMSVKKFADFCDQRVEDQDDEDVRTILQETEKRFLAEGERLMITGSPIVPA